MRPATRIQRASWRSHGRGIRTPHDRALPAVTLSLLLSLVGALAATARPAGTASPSASPSQDVLEGHVLRKPCAARDPLRRPFFGDLHVHTALSLDASTMQTRNRPADAYRFAKGARLGLQPYRADGTPMRFAQLARPLDFAAVTDHAELFGELHICQTPGLPGHDSIVCRVYRRWPRIAFFWMNTQASRAVRHDFCGSGGALCLEAARTPWKEIQEAAEAAYDRSAACRFTSFKGWEWTGAAGVGNNFHRNVIFANDVVPPLPISYIETPKLEDLWARLGRECVDSGQGCDVVVIPHNSNLSAGTMFQTLHADGTPITAEQARTRARYERLVEVMQHKGDSECLPGGETTDELCGFEKLAMNNFSGRFLSYKAEPPLPRQFIRHALKEGLVEERRLGVNPFRYGLIGSTDTHLATPGLVAESADYPGHGGAGKPPGDTLPQGLPDAIDFNPGGLAVLWAEENSRHALFAAMKRREAYGTSGPRIGVRFFGGWDYPATLCEEPAFARTGYERGVPMGAELPPRPPGEAAGASSPTFAVSALADAGVAGQPGTPLQRIQIVKGWLDGDRRRERVYDVAGDPRNGATVDLATCETRGPGAASLCSVWRDPDFDSTTFAFYYARVVENPSCRWSQKLCASAGVHCDDPSTIAQGFEDCCSEKHRPSIQERAWSSPIWYAPPITSSIASAEHTPGTTR